MNKKIMLIAVLSLCLSLVAGSTLAYFTSSEETHNVITTGNISIKLLEWADEERTTEFKSVEHVQPGDEVTKIVEVKNTGDNSAYIRVKIDIQTDEDTSLPITLDINDTNWTYSQNGWYYYNKILEKGETTIPLFTKVMFDGEDTGNTFKNKEVHIDVRASAVQSANNGRGPMDAVGWSI